MVLLLVVGACFVGEDIFERCAKNVARELKYVVVLVFILVWPRELKDANSSQRLCDRVDSTAV
jgi:hypothetical protein